MNEVEQLRQAMRATERTDGNVLDLGTIMREGRRLRRRRRLAGGGAAALSVAVVVGGVAVGVRLAGPPDPAPQPGLGATASAGPATGSPTPLPTTTRWEPRPQPVGEVVETGIRYAAGDERVLYFVPVDLPHAPRVTIGLVAGRRAPGGELTSDYLINDVEGSDRRAGFHQIGYDQSGGAATRSPVPAFGYFVGRATRIVGTVDGRKVAARLARWSTDADVVIFWFDPKALPPGVELDGIVAHDAKGRPL
ncbi:hypothetical protein [Micromonospora sp. WMMD812]|uniref:hypothetical protein n=1 Tax=Micromonospora sp. WMMD812 TaxID=3015152 RepID=UPI00248C6B63|nr:hypothetical protein [Micromonospora sp. WMMD812]WBB67890.1 hypothetical protein O7603_00485 [Micromonospora sp. WMMD812]